jgi:DNA (cytosine-5)-methyltransferase 1
MLMPEEDSSLTKLKVLDLFCGAGGFSFGFEEAGFDVVAGFDFDKEALLTFQHNHPNAQAIHHDLSQPIPNIENFKNVDVVIGGPPCQGFSISGKRDSTDERNQLYKAYLHTLEHIQPKAFIMENVPNLLAMEGGLLKDQIIADLSAMGYLVTYQILNASHFGVPQNRRRVFLVGMQDSYFTFPIPTTNDIINCCDAISDLSDSSIDDGDSYPMPPATEYQRLMRQQSKGIFNHEATKHTDKTKSIIALVPDGGNYKDLPLDLQGTRKVNIAWTRYASGKPSPTIDTGHNHHFHYQYNRVPTVRESARLQSFPDSFIFKGKKTSQYRQVGNAVPPILAKTLARNLYTILKKDIV